VSQVWLSFVEWVDRQISVRDGLFWMDLRWLIWLPAISFLVALFAVRKPSALAYTLGALAFISVVIWTVFLFRRRATKKRNWVEPDRWYDETNGY